MVTHEQPITDKYSTFTRPVSSTEDTVYIAGMGQRRITITRWADGAVAYAFTVPTTHGVAWVQVHEDHLGIFGVEVQSARHANLFYRVSLTDRPRCECPHYHYAHTCTHLKAVAPAAIQLVMAYQRALRNRAITARITAAHERIHAEYGVWCEEEAQA
ncbi:MAG: hypothetical protein KGH75_00490 [Rhodospirillales bacterium]|nr:hypothetical protein [Rhodospirillales bacterium]